MHDGTIQWLLEVKRGIWIWAKIMRVSFAKMSHHFLYNMYTICPYCEITSTDLVDCNVHGILKFCRYFMVLWCSGDLLKCYIAVGPSQHISCSLATVQYVTIYKVLHAPPKPCQRPIQRGSKSSSPHFQLFLFVLFGEDSIGWQLLLMQP